MKYTKASLCVTDGWSGDDSFRVFMQLSDEKHNSVEFTSDDGMDQKDCLGLIERIKETFENANIKVRVSVGDED